MLSALKNFIITFIIAAMIFGCVAFVAAQFLTTTISGILDTESEELGEILTPSATDAGAETTASPQGQTDTPVSTLSGESFNMVLIVTDYQPDIFNDYLPDTDTLTAWEKEGKNPVGVLNSSYRRIHSAAVLLFRVDKERQEFTVTSFPSIMRVYTAAGDQFFGDLYNLYGTEFIVDKVAALTGIPIHYFISLNITELSDIVSEIGGVSMYFTKDLYYNGAVSTTVKPANTATLPLLYKIGRRTVDGTGAMAIIMNEEYDGSVTYRNTLLCDFFKAFMTKITALGSTKFQAIYEKCLAEPWIDSDFTAQNLADAMELLMQWSGENFTVTVVDYPGDFIPATDKDAMHFNPNLTEGMELFRNYKPLKNASDSQ